MEFLLADDGSMVNVAHIIRIHKNGYAELTNNESVALTRGDDGYDFLDANPCNFAASTDSEIQYYAAESLIKALDNQLPEICQHLHTIASVLWNQEQQGAPIFAEDLPPAKVLDQPVKG